jgi:dihydromethanopterin reductase (acceptor)
LPLFEPAERDYIPSHSKLYPVFANRRSQDLTATIIKRQIEQIEMSEKRIAWAVTGAGHTLKECAELLLKYHNVDVFLSRAAEEVLHIYRLERRLNAANVTIYREAGASAPVVGRLSAGTYCVLVVAPATSNSVAKFVLGISDTLVTNMFAQAGKARVPVLVYPTDLESEMDSAGPGGDLIKIYPRPIDLENTAKLRAFAGVTVVSSREDLEYHLRVFAP